MPDPPSRTDRIAGCMLGLAIGDAFGAPFEGGPLERLVWRLIGRSGGRHRWTDDTQMTIDLVNEILDDGGIDLDRLAMRFAASHRWSRGYGPGAARTLKAIRRGVPWQRANRMSHADGSLGNGAAMRAPILGALGADHPDLTAELIADTSRITHAHPEGIAGARLIGLWIGAIVRGSTPTQALRAQRGHVGGPFDTQLEQALSWLEAGDTPSPDQTARVLGNGITARASCVASAFLGAAFGDHDLVELLQYAQAMRGDVDTISAMASAGWGAHRGRAALPNALLTEIEEHEALTELADRLARRGWTPADTMCR